MAKTGQIIAGKANTALTAKTFVKVGGEDNGFQPAGDNGIGVGVAYFDAAAGANASIAVSGVATVTAGDTITRGTHVAADANSEAVPAAAGENYCGIALQSAADGDEIDILLGFGQLDSDT